MRHPGRLLPQALQLSGVFQELRHHVPGGLRAAQLHRGALR